MLKQLRKFKTKFKKKYIYIDGACKKTVSAERRQMARCEDRDPRELLRDGGSAPSKCSAARKTPWRIESPNFA